MAQRTQQLYWEEGKRWTCRNNILLCNEEVVVNDEIGSGGNAVCFLLA